MQSKATNVNAYLEELSEERKVAMTKLRKTIIKNLPKGFKEEMSYGMIGYVVPHSVYPDGYHCSPKLPLPFMNIGSQKNFIVMHHLGLYGDPQLLKWFTDEYTKRVSTKLDMGKGCIRFKKPEQIPFDLMGELVAKVSMADWIAFYEKNIKKK
jgi:uncharacterized protein YdhG (YjbR/CyaY superfamily)